MLDDERLIHEISLGAAGIGICIGRVIAKRHPGIEREIANAAAEMRQHLSENGKVETMRVLTNFCLGLANPEKMPLLIPKAWQD